MKIMAVDLGDVRTGLAICDSLELLASPLCVIKQIDRAKLIKEIALIVGQNQVNRLVVGYPKNMNGSSGERANKAKVLAEELKKATKLDVVLWDERSTTIWAHKILTTNRQFGKKRKELVDAVAAVLILESYLEFKKLPKSERNG